MMKEEIIIAIKKEDLSLLFKRGRVIIVLTHRVVAVIE